MTNQDMAAKAKEKMKKQGNPVGNGKGNGGNGKNKSLTKSDIPKTMIGQSGNGVKKILDAYNPLIANVLPRHVTPEKLIQVSTLIVSRNQDLKKCTTKSLIGAIMGAGVSGLDLNPALGQAYLIPRWNSKTRENEANFQIGYQGYVQLMQQSGRVQTVYAEVVRENDEFRVSYGLDPDIKHVPNIDDPGELKYAYAVVKFKDGGHVFRVLNRRQVMARKNKSMAKDSKFSPWNDEDFEEEMWRKSAILAVRKYVPVDTDPERSLRFQNALTLDDKTVTSDMFDPGTHSVKQDQVEDYNAEDVDYTEDDAGEESAAKPKKENESSEKQMSSKQFYATIEKIQDAVIKTADQKTWDQLVERYTLEDLSKVPAGEYILMVQKLEKELQALNNQGRLL